jgi:hypothetical protein
MGKTRLEEFSDGVLAVIITIMVLEMKVPHGSDWQSLQPLLPVFLSFVLSFVYIGIYWNITICSIRCNVSTVVSCGRICICCSGCRWYRS